MGRRKERDERFNKLQRANTERGTLFGLTAAEYLEFLQREQTHSRRTPRQTAERLDQTVPPDKMRPGFEKLGITDPEELEAVDRRHRAGLAAAESRMPSKLEDAWTYSILETLANRLMKAAGGTEWALRKMPTFGTLPLGELNAMAIRVPRSNEYLIAFQHGVFGFANLMVKAVAASYPIIESNAEDGARINFHPNEVAKRWDENPEPLHRLADLLTAYLIVGHPHAARQYFLGNPHAYVSSAFLDGIELFIFGHEFGHVVGGHLDIRRFASQRVGSTEVERINPDWEMEFEADRIGCDLAMGAMREAKVQDSIAFTGIDLFFSAMQLVDQALSVLLHGEVVDAPESATHPPTIMRRDALRAKMKGQLPESELSMVVGFSSSAQVVLDQAWRRIQPQFVELHQRGIAPAVFWHS